MLTRRDCAEQGSKDPALRSRVHAQWRVQQLPVHFTSGFHWIKLIGSNQNGAGMATRYEAQFMTQNGTLSGVLSKYLKTTNQLAKLWPLNAPSVPTSSMCLDRSFRACQMLRFLTFHQWKKVGHLVSFVQPGNDHFWICDFDSERNRVEKLHRSSFWSLF